MDRRKALAASVTFAVCITAAGTAMAANLGLLQVGTQVDPVGKLDAATVAEHQHVEVRPQSPVTTTVTSAPADTVPAVDPGASDPDTATQSGPDAPSTGQRADDPVNSTPAASPASPASPAVAVERSDDDHHEDHPVTPTTAAPTPPPSTPTTTAPKSTTTTRHHDDDGGERDD